MFDKLTFTETLILLGISILLFPAGPFLALLAIIAINQNRK